MSVLYKTCAAPFELKSCQPQGVFCGYASVFHERDDQGDRVVPGAFDRSLKKMHGQTQAPKMLWQHDRNEPIGIWEEVHEDSRGLFVKGRLLLDIRRAQEAYTLMKARVLDSLSIGYRVIQATKGTHSSERQLTEVDLFEISLVTFPANRAAKITDLKNREEDSDVIIQRLHRTIHILKS